MVAAVDPFELLADLPLHQSGAWRPPPDDVSVRPYPYPYVAAFTVSNDLDSQLPVAFDSWHAFINGTKPTADGDGLGLEIGDSFWVWDDSRTGFALHWHPPDRQSPVDTRCLGRLVELSRLGWLDTLHSMGNWYAHEDQFVAPDSFRDRAVAVLDRLEALGVRPTVYVNHSSSLTNIAGPWGGYQRGDVPENPYYCLDLLKAFGFRFFWLESGISYEKFGNELEYRSEHELARAIRRYPWAPWLRRIEGNSVYPLELPGDRDEQRRRLVTFFNRTLIPVDGRDGNKILSFKRQRHFDQPVMSTFSLQVSEAGLDALEEMHGVAIVYQHFGLSGPRGRSPERSQPERKKITQPSLDEHARARWRDIAARFHSGRLWVATTSRMLRYLWLRDALRFSVARTEDAWHVTLHEMNCSAYGREHISVGDMNGLSLSVPASAPEVVVTVDGWKAPLPVRRAADRGWPGRDAVFLPWSPLEWPG